jgi:4-amino-4-deoxy-L-arabinose transferase-like glycosyltransferase
MTNWTQIAHSARSTWLGLIAILLVAAVVRLTALDSLPPGLAADEASNGYDAYSLLLTGRDQHGNLLPLVMRSFNDYRMPLFIYSAIPFVGLFGLTSVSVRLAAAVWGLLTVPVIYWLGARMMGRRAGLAAAFFLAVSSWHISFSRIALEGTLMTLCATLALALVWQWHTDHREHWLILAGAVMGLSIYAYSTAKLLVPALVLLIGGLWWRDLKQRPKAALVAVGVLVVLALPMLYLSLRYPEQMQARYNQIALFRPGRPLPAAIAESVRLFIAHFSPRYLFVAGDADILQHPPFGGQLYWVQAPLLAMSLLALGQARNRRAVLFSLLWLVLAAVPSALTEPSVAGSPSAWRNLVAVAPFQLLSAFGLIWMGDMARSRHWLRAGLIGLAIAGVVLNAAWFLRGYATLYPRQVAGRFNDGMELVVKQVQTLEKDYPTVVYSDYFSWPYIYVLFFTRYDPAALHADPFAQGNELFAPVTQMGKYAICDVEQAYAEMEHGLFIAPAWKLVDAPTLAILHRPADGKPIFRLVAK